MATPGVTLSGKLTNITGAGDAGQVILTLCNYGDIPPIVIGTTDLAALTVTVQAAADGTWSTTLWGNDQVTPSSTYYVVDIYSSTGAKTSSTAYKIVSGSYDLSNLAPLTSFTTPSFPYMSGIVGSQSAPSHEFVTGIDNTGHFSYAQPAATDVSGLATVAKTGSYTDLSNTPVFPAPQVNSDWNAVSGVAQILNKPALATVATSGSYNDLTSKPTIPAAQVNSDWNASSGVAQILNKPTIPPTTAGVAHKFFSAWSQSTGLFTQTQPDFSDLTGSILASQLPLPTLISLGGVKAITPVAHQWMTSIDTTGTPQLSQPAASDLSNGTTGTGAVVLASNPTFTSPVTFTGAVGSIGVDTSGAHQQFSRGSANYIDAITAGGYFNWTVNGGTNAMTLDTSGNLSIIGQYRINGTQIAASNLSNGTTGSGAVVLGTSPTFTNNASISGSAGAGLTLTSSSGAATLVLSGATATQRYLGFQTAGSNRWIFQTDTTTESGSNAGANFIIQSRTDAGAALANVLTLTRSTGAAAFSGTVSAPTINATSGFQVGGTALAASNLSNGVTGTNKVVLSTSPTFDAGVVSGTGVTSTFLYNISVPRTGDYDNGWFKDYQDEAALCTLKGATCTFNVNPPDFYSGSINSLFVDDSNAAIWNNGDAISSIQFTVDFTGMAGGGIAPASNGTYAPALTFRVGRSLVQNIQVEFWNADNSTWVSRFNAAPTLVNGTASGGFWVMPAAASPQASFVLTKVRFTLTMTNPLTSAFYIQRVMIYHATANYDPWHLRTDGGTVYGNINTTGQFQVNGSQIAASNLSNGTTGSGAVVLASAPTISGLATHSDALKFTGNASLPAASAGNQLLLAAGYGSPNSGRLYIGDGSGWKFFISTRSGSVDTDRFTFLDTGAFTATGTVTAPTVAATNYTGTTADVHYSAPAGYVSYFGSNGADIIRFNNAAYKGLVSTSDAIYGWGNSTSASGLAPDTGLSRSAAGVVAVGNGNVGDSSGKVKASNAILTSIPIYASNAAAITGGLTAGMLYRTGADPDHLCIVH